MSPAAGGPWSKVGWPLGISLASVLVLAWVGAVEVVPVVTTLRASGDSTGLDAPARRSLDAHKELMQRSIDRFVGRSLFDRMPPDWPRAAPVQRTEPVAVREAPPAPPPAPPPRREYAGPKPLAIIGQSVLFDGAQAPTPVGSAFGEVTLVRIELPYNAVVQWDRGEHSVPLFVSDAALWKSTPEVPDPFPMWTAPQGSAAEPRWGDGTQPRTPSGARRTPEGAPSPMTAPGARSAVQGNPATRDTAAQQPSAGAPTSVGAPASVDARGVAAVAPVPEPATDSAAPGLPGQGPQATGVPPPEALTQADIDAMTRAQAAAALARISAARVQPNLDSQTRDRLQRESEMLRARQARQTSQ